MSNQPREKIPDRFFSVVSMHKYLLSIENPKIFQLKVSGGKGLNLARLAKNGFNVPPFFVISSSLYNHVIEINEIDQLIKKIATQQSITAYKQIQSKILAAEIPEFIITQINSVFNNLVQNSRFKTVAVRSSALVEDFSAHSFAGQLETYLDIQNEKQLQDSIKGCWASLWNDRVYNYISKIQDKITPQPIAVIVQQMVPAEYSGICFTIDPIDDEQEWIMIEAYYGSGAEIVGGQVNPFQYRVHRRTLEIESDSVQSVPLLFSKDKLAKIAQTGLNIEKSFGVPQDIEWAFLQDKIYILQSRPITTVAKKQVTPDGKLWSNYFFGERFPQPVSPLGWSVLKPLIEKNAFREPLHFLGFHEIARAKITKCFSGRPYTRLKVFQALHSLFPTAYVSSDKRKLFYERPLSFKESLTRILKNGFPILKSLLSSIDWIPPLHLRNWRRFISFYSDKIKSLNKANLPFLSEQELWQLNAQAERLSDRLLSLHRWSITFADLFYHFLIFLIRNWLPQKEAEQIVVELHRGIPGNKTVEMNIELWKLSRLLKGNRFHPPVGGQVCDGGGWNQSLIGTQGWKSFIKKFGHRSTSLDIAVSTFADDVDYILNLIQPYLLLSPEFSPEIKQIEFATGRENQRQAVFKNLLKQPCGFLKKQFFKMLLNWSEQFVLLRENQRYYWHHALAINRKIFLEFGKRFVDRGWLENQGHIFFLTRNEIEHAFSLGMLVSELEIAGRIKQHQQWQQIQPPAIIDDSYPVQPDTELTSKKLVGIGASPGIVTGQARVLTIIQEMSQIQPGEILIVPTTDPGWTPLFGIIRGLVMEVGGVLSHGAIVAREFGIPAATSVAGATLRITTGMRITVNGTKGVVWIHDN